MCYLLLLNINGLMKSGNFALSYQKKLILCRVSGDIDNGCLLASPLLLHSGDWLHTALVSAVVKKSDEDVVDMLCKVHKSQCSAWVVVLQKFSKISSPKPLK